MSFDWKLYVDLSEELINQQRTPALKDAYLRSAISRSYYGIFCIAREPLRPLPPINVHKFVREKYNSSVSKNERQIGIKLSRLWMERKAADYDTDKTFDDARARTAYQMAVDTLKLLKEL